MLRTLVDRGLVDYVAMDVKNSPGKYARTIGLSEIDLAPIDESIRLLMQGRVPYEFRTTVVAEYHEAADFDEIGAWIQGANRYFLQAYTERDTVPDHTLHAPDAAKMREFRDRAALFVKNAEIRGIDT